MTDEMREEITALVEDSANVYVSSVDENGYPNTKQTVRKLGRKTLKKDSNCCII